MIDKIYFYELSPSSWPPEGGGWGLWGGGRGGALGIIVEMDLALIIQTHLCRTEDIIEGTDGMNTELILIIKDGRVTVDLDVLTSRKS